jgi:hypothetical protein
MRTFDSPAVNLHPNRLADDGTPAINLHPYRLAD